MGISFIYSYVFRHLHVDLSQKLLMYIGVNKCVFLMHCTYIRTVAGILLIFAALCEHILISECSGEWPNMPYYGPCMFTC